MRVYTTIHIERPPQLSKHEDMIRIDFGDVILETTVTGLKLLVGSIMTQAAKQQIYLTTN